jgi:hypothetical protein
MQRVTVFDPADDSGLAYVWDGRLTVNVFQRDPDEPVLAVGLGPKVDAFTFVGPDAPSVEEVAEAVERRHARRGPRRRRGRP